jgi:hypothetical protein
LLKDDLLKAIAVNPCQTFWTSWTPCYIAEYDMYLHLLYFYILWIKIPDGYQIASLEELGLWSTSQLSLWNGVFIRRSESSIRCLCLRLSTLF